MKYRSLGKTGLKVSELSFGAGGFWGMRSFDEKEAARLLDVALDKGVNLIDTGPNYSGANAEIRLGRALKGKIGSVVFGTKVGTHYLNGKHVKDYSLKSVERSIMQSLNNLQTDHIPLLQLHSLPRHMPDETMSYLFKLKREGVIGHLGASVGGENAKKVIADDHFDTIMIQYNVIERRSPAELIQRAGEKGMGVLIKSPLAQTLYSNDILKVRKMSDVWYLLRALKNHRAKFLKGMKYRFINEIPGFKGSEIALGYVLQNPHVSSAVIGTVNESHLVTNLLTSERSVPLEVVRRIEAL
ncbi:aldo/keto reductase [Cohnella sp. JJ-181]|uniref:aldo/keto reductase n=1 Tax=Cohnella rhizoplanae TaxID=2974897 RepID=UPI0022FF5B3E|nr:aldo/keto reductase [Cohnella sp. JJ-181]CAI6073760.1 hypothetical protein COHCIP112018_02399 [Cohnella sp. JJ-181]